jgi:hypothetical protein
MCNSTPNQHRKMAIAIQKQTLMKRRNVQTEADRIVFDRNRQSLSNNIKYTRETT